MPNGPKLLESLSQIGGALLKGLLPRIPATTPVACCGSNSVATPPPDGIEEYIETFPDIRTQQTEPTHRRHKRRTPRNQKFFIVICENIDYSQALARPFLAKLAKRGTLFTNFHGLFHPSQPNYIAMVAGTNTFDRVLTVDDGVVHTDFTIRNDANVKILGARHLGDLLDSRRVSWKVYMENYAGAFVGQKTPPPELCPLPPDVRTTETVDCALCFRYGAERANFPILSCPPPACFNYYVRYHNAFLSFENVADDCARIIRRTAPSSQLYTDIRRRDLPQVSIYLPNQNNNAHDTDIDYCDAAMEATFGPLLDDPRFMEDMVFVMMFDENGTWRDDPTNNQIYVSFVGPNVKRGERIDTHYTHYNLLRTLEDYFKTGTLGKNDATADPITGFWRRPKRDPCHTRG